MDFLYATFHSEAPKSFVRFRRDSIDSDNIFSCPSKPFTTVLTPLCGRYSSYHALGRTSFANDSLSPAVERFPKLPLIQCRWENEDDEYECRWNKGDEVAREEQPRIPRGLHTSREQRDKETRKGQNDQNGRTDEELSMLNELFSQLLFIAMSSSYRRPLTRNVENDEECREQIRTEWNDEMNQLNCRAVPIDLG